MAPHYFHDIRSVRGPILRDFVGAPRERYNLIYADPCWDFQNYSAAGEDRNAKAWYDCMSVEDMAKMPVVDLADEDCALFMWVTDPTLPQGLWLMQQWGFTYVTVAFQWVKLNKLVYDRRVVDLDRDVAMTTGYYTRSNPEMVVIGSRGYPVANEGIVNADGVDLSEAYTMLLGKRGSPKRISASVRQTVFAPRGMHSEKPLLFRDELVRLMKADRRIELFCRHDPTPDWDVWGDQVGAHADGSIHKRRPAPKVLPLFDEAA